VSVFHLFNAHCIFNYIGTYYTACMICTQKITKASRLAGPYACATCKWRYTNFSPSIFDNVLYVSIHTICNFSYLLYCRCSETEYWVNMMDYFPTPTVHSISGTCTNTWSAFGFNEQSIDDSTWFVTLLWNVFKALRTSLPISTPCVSRDHDNAYHVIMTKCITWQLYVLVKRSVTTWPWRLLCLTASLPARFKVDWIIFARISSFSFAGTARGMDCL
jgi:hypothetical protein